MWKNGLQLLMSTTEGRLAGPPRTMAFDHCSAGISDTNMAEIDSLRSCEIIDPQISAFTFFSSRLPTVTPFCGCSGRQADCRHPINRFYHSRENPWRHLAKLQDWFFLDLSLNGENISLSNTLQKSSSYSEIRRIFIELGPFSPREQQSFGMRYDIMASLNIVLISFLAEDKRNNKSFSFDLNWRNY